MWDVKKSRICQGSILTGSPVIRASFLPGDDHLAVLNGDVAMKIYKTQNLEPSHALMGTRDVCADFAMLSNGSVVAWSRDSHLCVWDLSRIRPSESVVSTNGTNTTGVGSIASIVSASLPSVNLYQTPTPISSPGPANTNTNNNNSNTNNSNINTEGRRGMSLRDEIEALMASPVEGHVRDCDVVVEICEFMLTMYYYLTGDSGMQRATTMGPIECC
jgi:hypothetical protein